jgi:hypothetical protein
MSGRPITQHSLERRVKRLARGLKAIEQPITLQHLGALGASLSLQCHLSIVSEPYLTRIVMGEKSIESRFSKVACLPYRAVCPHDVLLLKERAGPLRAIVVVSFVSSHGPLAPGQARDLIRGHQEGLRLEKEFVAAKRNSRYATLMHLGACYAVPAVRIAKHDRRPWVVLTGAPAQRELFHVLSGCRTTVWMHGTQQHRSR